MVKVRRIISTVMVLAFVLACVSPVFALPEPITKIKDNVVDIVTAPWEVGHCVVDEVKAAEFKPFGLMGGLLKGGFYSVKKMGTGLVHIVMMPLDYVHK